VVKFNALAAESQAGQMMLAISAMLVPALFFRVAQESHQERLIHPVSLGVFGGAAGLHGARDSSSRFVRIATG